jgi:pimeloyl-ACP methyl ester carboxylesterase
MLGVPAPGSTPDEADAAAFLPSPVPTLYLHGADDGCMGADLVASAADYLPTEGSRIETLDGVGHFLHLEDPARVNALVAGFLDG